MSLKLNVGLSRKIGEANYGSRGASCHVEVELDTATLSQDPTRFQQRVQEVFAACRQAVEEELSQQPTGGNGARHANARPVRHGLNGQAVTGAPPRPATANQVKAIRAIAHQAGIGLASELSQRYGVRSPHALNVGQASQLIDVLKEQLDSQPVAG